RLTSRSDTPIAHRGGSLTMAPNDKRQALLWDPMGRQGPTPGANQYGINKVALDCSSPAPRV
ncbi:MAG: hypothetical protein WD005_04350, partial [Haliea sp.]